MLGCQTMIRPFDRSEPGQSWRRAAKSRDDRAGDMRRVDARRRTRRGRRAGAAAGVAARDRESDRGAGQCAGQPGGRDGRRRQRAAARARRAGDHDGRREGHDYLRARMSREPGREPAVHRARGGRMRGGEGAAAGRGDPLRRARGPAGGQLRQRASFAAIWASARGPPSPVSRRARSSTARFKPPATRRTRRRRMRRPPTPTSRASRATSS